MASPDVTCTYIPDAMKKWLYRDIVYLEIKCVFPIKSVVDTFGFTIRKKHGIWKLFTKNTFIDQPILVVLWSVVHIWICLFLGIIQQRVGDCVKLFDDNELLDFDLKNKILHRNSF